MKIYISAPLALALADRGSELGGDDDLVSVRAEGHAQELLRLGAAVDVRRVEERDARLSRRVDDGLRLGLVDAHAEVVASQSDEGDGQGAERARFHARTLYPATTLAGWTTTSS